MLQKNHYLCEDNPDQEDLYCQIHIESERHPTLLSDTENLDNFHYHTDNKQWRSRQDVYPS